jgi:hypothetical protein
MIAARLPNSGGHSVWLDNATGKRSLENQELHPELLAISATCFNRS